MKTKRNFYHLTIRNKRLSKLEEEVSEELLSLQEDGNDIIDVEYHKGFAVIKYRTPRNKHC
jgi:hypothetical protein